LETVFFGADACGFVVLGFDGAGFDFEELPELLLFFRVLIGAFNFFLIFLTAINSPVLKRLDNIFHHNQLG